MTKDMSEPIPPIEPGAQPEPPVIPKPAAAKSPVPEGEVKNPVVGAKPDLPEPPPPSGDSSRESMPGEMSDLRPQRPARPDQADALSEGLPPELVAEMVNKAKEVLGDIGLTPKPDINQAQLMAAFQKMQDIAGSDPESLVAVADTLGVDPATFVDVINNEDPQKAKDVEKIFEERGKMLKRAEEGQAEPETTDQVIDRELKETEGKKMLEEMRATIKDMGKKDFNLKGDTEKQKAITEQVEHGKTFIRDLMSHHMFESKQFKLFKGGSKGLLFIIFYLALALISLEMNLLIAIGKSGGK